MPLLGQRRGGLLSALQIGDEGLLDIGIGEHLGETFGALVSGIAEQREAVRPEPADHLDHQHDGGEKEGQPNSGACAGAHGSELHWLYLIAH